MRRGPGREVSEAVRRTGVDSGNHLCEGSAVEGLAVNTDLNTDIKKVWFCSVPSWKKKVVANKLCLSARNVAVTFRTTRKLWWERISSALTLNNIVLNPYRGLTCELTEVCQRKFTHQITELTNESSNTVTCLIRSVLNIQSPQYTLISPLHFTAAICHRF